MQVERRIYDKGAKNMGLFPEAKRCLIRRERRHVRNAQRVETVSILRDTDLQNDELLFGCCFECDIGYERVDGPEFEFIDPRTFLRDQDAHIVYGEDPLVLAAFESWAEAPMDLEEYVF